MALSVDFTELLTLKKPENITGRSLYVIESGQLRIFKFKTMNSQTTELDTIGDLDFLFL